MKKRILAYLDYIDELLKEENVDWDVALKNHLDQIAFFSHERLVHLIVFVLVAICTVVSILALVISYCHAFCTFSSLLYALLSPGELGSENV